MNFNKIVVFLNDLYALVSETKVRFLWNLFRNRIRKIKPDPFTSNNQI